MPPDPLSPSPFARVRLLCCDVDGVMTDGGLYYTEAGDVMRKYNVKDGMGLLQVKAAGVVVAIISASATGSIAARGRQLKIEHTYCGVEDKLTVLAGLCATLGIDLSEVCHIADDVNDLPVLRAVGVPVTVADGVAEVKAVAAFVTRAAGGAGAVRELCDRIVAARVAATV